MSVGTGNKLRLALRFALLAIGVAMLSLGLHNGEHREVHDKAVVICLECIGIG